ncbi:MAG: hypothetical protein ABWK04_04045 [Hydrogenobacter sp.]|uniref:hypothetical protein n=1 Tax=Hydrogenobacter thermophilus TaxID=940 RepID=UPI0030F841AB
MKRLALLLFILGFSFAHEHGKEQELTLKQVMQMVSLSAQKMLYGFMLSNDALIMEGAKEIAEHPMPKGGPLQYIDPSRREEFLRLMPSFERQVHGSAEEVIRFIKEGKKEEALKAYTDMLQGCMSCHELFRDRIRGR